MRTCPNLFNFLKTCSPNPNLLALTYFFASSKFAPGAFFNWISWKLMWEPRPGSVLCPLSLLWYWVLCRIVYLACFAKIAKKFENRRKSASVGPTRERARRTPIFVDFQIFSRFLQNMPNTLSYTDPYQVRRGRSAPGPLFGKNLNLKKIRLFQNSGKNRKHLDRSYGNL